MLAWWSDHPINKVLSCTRLALPSDHVTKGTTHPPEFGIAEVVNGAPERPDVVCVLHSEEGNQDEQVLPPVGGDEAGPCGVG